MVGCLTLMTMSQHLAPQIPAIPDASLLTISRNRRLHRFRTTAFPSLRVAVIPKRDPSSSDARMKTEKKGVWNFHPRSYTARNCSLERRVRSFLPPSLSAPTATRVILIVAWGQSFAAFCASALQDQPASLCAHTLTKPVSLGATPVIWLKCPFHYKPLSIKENP